MSRLLLTSDLHLGHKNAIKFRPQFSSQDEHDEIIFDNLASGVNKRDSIILLGDIAFNHHWLGMIASIKCAKKTLILGNHDTEHGISMMDLAKTYDRIESLYSKRNIYFSHCPIHPEQFRGKLLNIHGHMHDKTINDDRYVNVCVEQTEFKPIAFCDAVK